MTKTAARNADMRRILSTRRCELHDAVQGRIRDGRSERPHEVHDNLEHSDADMQGDIELALLGMRAETLIRIDEALLRLDAGQYGFCRECESEISEQRLRALPFAVRCQMCEETREQQQGHARRGAQQRAGFSLFPELVSAS